MLNEATAATQLDEYVECCENPCAMRLRGQNVGLEEIVARYRLGFTAESMRQDFPALSFEQVYGAITYYLHHKAEVDEYAARVAEIHPLTVASPITAHEKITATIRAHAHEWEDA